MRGAVLAALLLVLAGCTAGPTGAPPGEDGEAPPGKEGPPDGDGGLLFSDGGVQGLKAFTARFEGGGCLANAALGGPDQIVDAYGEHVMAYRLVIDARNKPHPDGQGAEPCQVADRLMQLPATVHLDGGLRVVRITDAPYSHSRSGGDILQDVHFEFRGMLPPLGLFWDAMAQEQGPLDFTLGGTPFEKQLVSTDGWKGLQGDIPVVEGSQWVQPKLDYRSDGWVPEAVRFPVYASWFPREEPQVPPVLERVGLEWGEELPPIPASRVTERSVDLAQGLPGADEELFSMNTSLSRAWSVIVDTDPQAQRHRDEGCLLRASASSFGGLQTNPDRPHSEAYDQLRIRFVTDHEGNSTRWTYTKTTAGAQSVVSELLTSAAGEYVTHANDSGPLSLDCGTFVSPATWTWAGLLTRAYEMDPVSGIVPCALRLEWFGGSVSDLAPGVEPVAITGASFGGHTGSNHPWIDEDGEANVPSTSATVWTTPHDGAWHMWSLPADVVAGLDAGTWDPSPSYDFPDEPDENPFRCLPNASEST